MNTTDSSYVEREKRFSVQDLKLEVIVNRVDREDSSEYYFANVVNVSRRGMKLRVPCRLRFGEKIQIRLVSTDDDLHYFGVGTILRVRSNSEDTWEISCSLETELHPELMDSIVSDAGEERRKQPRLPFDRDVFLQREGAIAFVPAQVVNVSEGGFCIVAPESIGTNQRLKFQIENSNGKRKQVVGDVCWQAKSDKGYRIGCSFVDARSHKALIDGGQSNAVEKVSWILVGSAVLALAFPVLFSIFLPPAEAAASKTDKRDSVQVEVESDELDESVTGAEQATEMAIDEQPRRTLAAERSSRDSVSESKNQQEEGAEIVEPGRFESVPQSPQEIESPVLEITPEVQPPVEETSQEVEETKRYKHQLRKLLKRYKHQLRKHPARLFSHPFPSPERWNTSPRNVWFSF